MKPTIRIVFIVMFAVLLLSFGECSGKQEQISIAPKPVSYVEASGEFTLNNNSKIIVMADDYYNEIKKNSAEYLAVILRGSTGFNINIADGSEKPADGDIVLSLDYFEGAPEESYTIKVEKNKITVMAKMPAGLFRAVQTLRQLFGPDIESKNIVQKSTNY